MKKVFLLLSFLVPSWLFAHGVGEVYSLPIPLDYYLYTSGIVVFLSFIISPIFIKFFIKFEKKEIYLSERFRKVAGYSSVFLLFLTILTGIFGSESVSKNFATIFFWVYFIIGINMLTFLFGDIWKVLNPWQFICKDIFKFQKGKIRTHGLVPVFLVFSFYWFELISGFSFIPSGVGYLLLAYTFINVLGYKYFSNWFSSGELFSVLFSFVSNFSITKVVTKNNAENENGSTQISPYFYFIFVCILLAGISYDSIKETLFWFTITESLNLEFESTITQTVGLVSTVFPFLLLFLLSILSIKYFTVTKESVAGLIEKYLPSLSPIVLGYFLAHNFSVFIVSIPIFFPTLLDPFGLDWNLFGLNSLRFSPLILGAKFIWYIEIFFIVAGHIFAVMYAHTVSKKLFDTKGEIFKADLFLLPLMITYTIITLWLISLPLVSG
jgi:hypothetical protein